MFLTNDQLTALTDRIAYSAQIGWLRKHDITFMVGASGAPKVLRSHIEKRLGGDAPETPAPPGPHKPFDFTRKRRG